MKKQSVLLALTVAMLAVSCTVVGTLYPLSENEDDFIFKKELVGKWGDRKDNTGYFVVDTTHEKNGKLYLIKDVRKNNKNNTSDTTQYKGFLLSINSAYYLDCWLSLEKEFSSHDKKYEDQLIARHFILRLSFPDAALLEISALDTEELIKLIDQKKIPLHYAQLKKDDYLILDKPEVLQKGIAESKKYPLLYRNKNILHRLE